MTAKKPTVSNGVYRHYKGQLYEVLGMAHDANADSLFDAIEELQFPDGREVVIYIGLQLDKAHMGLRRAVRSVEDFIAIVCADPACPDFGKAYTQAITKHPVTHLGMRFQYLGARLEEWMLPEDMQS